MSRDNVASGICGTCKHASACSLSKQPNRPLFYCEEFETSGPEPVGEEQRGSDALLTSLSQDDLGEHGLREFWGLCSDCASRLCCALSDVEGGVWHCEEYDWMPPSSVGQGQPPVPVSQDAGPEAIRRILEQHEGARGALIAILEEIQARYGYLPAAALQAVCNETGHSLVDVYGVATFYRSFSLTPRGRHLICVCQGTACHVRGAPVIVEELERQLGISSGETTPDHAHTLETVNCLGACALGPIVVVDGQYFSNVGTAKARLILKKAGAGAVRSQRPAPVASGN